MHASVQPVARMLVRCGPNPANGPPKSGKPRSREVLGSSGAVFAAHRQSDDCEQVQKAIADAGDNVADAIDS